MELDRSLKIKQEEEADRDNGAASEPLLDHQSSLASAPATVKQEDALSDAQTSVPVEVSVKLKSESRAEAAEDGEQTILPGQVAPGCDGSRSSSGSEEILPDRTRGLSRSSRALPLEKVDVLQHMQGDAEPLADAEPDPLGLDEPEAEAEPVKERPTRLRRAVVPRQPALGALSEDSYDDYSSSEEEEMRKTIMIGSAYQAVVPEGFAKYGSERPYKHADKLLWEPKSGLDSEQIEQYLQSAQEVIDSSADGINVLPMGVHVRDDEQALHLLMQCNHNVEEALRKRRFNPPAPPHPDSPWSDEECRNFENGLLTFGKDFHTIQAQKVRTRSVSEIVQFYYLWKKTERHDVFANKMRPDKKKYMLHPGVTLVVYELLDKENQKETASKDGLTV